MSYRVIIRPARNADLDGVVRVEKSAWPPGLQASREQFIERLEIYPQGFLVALVPGKLVGVLTSQRVDYGLSESVEGWEKTAGAGWIKKTHRPWGNALHVVSLGVYYRFQNRGIGTELVRAAQRHAVSLDLQYVFLDSRLPGYEPYSRRGIAIQDYVFALGPNDEPIDPGLRFYNRLGFHLTSPSQIIPSSMAHDSASVNYGVRMVWSSNQ